MTELIVVVTITLLAVISPGPDFAMVTRNSLMLSRRSGVLTALGIGLGVTVHVSYTLLGVGLLIRQSLWLFNAVKLIGAIYLVYLGVKMLMTKAGGRQADAPAAPLSDLAALRTGFLTNALNPKTTVFIVSLFMQAVRPDTPLIVQIGYGAFIALAHAGWFSLVAVCFSATAVRDRLLSLRHWIPHLRMPARRLRRCARHRARRALIRASAPHADTSAGSTPPTHRRTDAPTHRLTGAPDTLRGNVRTRARSIGPRRSRGCGRPFRRHRTTYARRRYP